MRVFLAAYPPQDVQDDFARMVGGLAVARPRERSVRLHTPERWHLTVAFIGEVATPEPAVAALAEIGVGCAAFGVRIAGGKTLGRGKFTHLVTGVVAEEPGGLVALGEVTRKALKRHRLPYDKRPWQPHVTIARPGDVLSREELAGDLAVVDGYRSPVWRVDEVRLMQSQLGPSPEYDVLASVALAG